MKIILPALIFILLISSCKMSHFTVSDKEYDIAGTYYYEDYCDIGPDGCYGEKWTIKLSDNGSFFSKRYNENGDYWIYAYSWGTYKTKNDTLYFFSPVPDSLNIAPCREEQIPDTLFKFTTGQFGRDKLISIEGSCFFTVDSTNLSTEKINWLYTIPKYDEIKLFYKNPKKIKYKKEFSPGDISFIFKRSEIKDYIIFYFSPDYYYGKKIQKRINDKMMLADERSTTVKISNCNNIKINGSNKNLKYTYGSFFDFSTFRFLIKKRKIIYKRYGYNKEIKKVFRKKNTKNIEPF